mgnify:FL=1
MMLLILFVLNKRINWKKKIAPVLFVLFFMASFANKQLDLYGTDCIFRIRCLADSRICMHFLY